MFNIKISLNVIALYALCIVFILLSFSCQESKETNATTTSIHQPEITMDTVCFLDYGYPPPPNYINAKEIIGHLFNIKFITVSGCEVWQSLLDSVEIENKKGIQKLAKRSPPQSIDSINGLIEKEYNCLQKIDSVLNQKKTWKTNGYVYYSKHNHTYYANHFTYKDVSFCVNQIIKIDSLSLKIIENRFLKKDTLIKYLKNLHDENN